MPTIVSRRPGGLRIVPLDGLGHLHIAATTLAPKRYGFALAWRFPAAVPFLANPHVGDKPHYHGGEPNLYAGQPLWQDVTEFQREIIAAAPLDFASDSASVQRVADVALDTGTRAGDVARTAEALSLFRNLDRLNADAYNAAQAACATIVEAYWTIGEWLAAPQSEHPASIQAGDAFLVLR